MHLDFSVLDFLQEHLRNGFLDFLMPVVTLLGDGGIFWIVLTVLLIVFKKTRRTGLSMAAALVIEALFCNVVLKTCVGRIRPYEINKAVKLLIKPPLDSSFPSGHTGASFAAASAMMFTGFRFWPCAAVLASLVAFSRLYLYVHFPSDVLFGAIFGIISGWLAAKIISAAFKRRNWRQID